jgi:hypothetical protein
MFTCIIYCTIKYTQLYVPPHQRGHVRHYFGCDTILWGSCHAAPTDPRGQINNNIRTLIYSPSASIKLIPWNKVLQKLTATELPRVSLLSLKPTIHYLGYKSPTLVPITNRFNPLQTLTSSLFKIHFNIILQSTSRYPKWLLPFKIWEFYGTVHQQFIDFKEAYDSVRRKVLYGILIEFGIPRKLVAPIQMCLNETYSTVRIGKY